MRKLERLSYSAMSLWEKDPQTFFLTRLAGTRTRREPQGLPAAIGSAFDARIKSSLAASLWSQPPAELKFDALYEAQVEPQNRSQQLLDDSALLVSRYVACGRYAELMNALATSPTPPRFESEVLTNVEGVPFTTKPDLTYVAGQTQVIHDWKVRSFYSTSGASPTQGYVQWRDSMQTAASHKKFRGRQWEGVVLHDGCLSEFSDAYADQTAMYAWALGVEPGNAFIASIDEMVCRPGSIRVAELRATVSEPWQRKLLNRLKRCWNSIQAGHVFVDMTFEQSQAKQSTLERAAQTMGCDDEDDRYMASLGKKAWY